MFFKNEREFWTDKEIKEFILYYPVYTNEYLLENIFKNRTRVSLINMSVKLNIKKDFNSIKEANKPILLNKLEIFFKENGYTPVSTDLTLLGLPSEITYRRYFGSYRKACLLLGIDVNISIFGKAKAGISSKGDICLSKAEFLITEFFIKNNIEYMKDIKYKDILPKKKQLCGNKISDWYFPKENIIVEYFGMPEKESYKKRIEEKRKICNIAKIKLIELYRKDLKDKKLKEIFNKYINPN